MSSANNRVRGTLPEELIYREPVKHRLIEEIEHSLLRSSQRSVSYTREQDWNSLEIERRVQDRLLDERARAVAA